MAIEVLERTDGRGMVWDLSNPGMLYGERPDVPIGNGINQITKAIEVGDNWFVYGEPYQGAETIWTPPSPDFDTYSDLSSDRLLKYWIGTTKPGIRVEDAQFAASALQDMIRDPEGRVTLFETSMLDWVENPGVSILADQLHLLFGADEPLRDDTQNTNDPLAKYGTTIYLAFSGEVPFFLVERSELGYDKAGRLELKRLVEAVKTFDPQVVTSTIQQLSFPEAMRVRELMQRWRATDEQRRRVFARADRSIGRGGRAVTDRDIRRLMEQEEDRPEESLWRLAWQAGKTALRSVVDSAFMWRLARQGPRPKGKHRPQE